MTDRLWKEFDRYQFLDCDKCHRIYQCTPEFDFYDTPLWKGTGRVCELCFRELVSDLMQKGI